VNFYTKKRKRPTVPIITLIDILAILLIFFIVTSTFKKRESLVKVNLPKSSEMSESEDRENRIPLAVNSEGQVSVGEQLMTFEQLPAALMELKRIDPAAKLELKADAETPLKLVVKIWDAITKAGVDINDMPLRISMEK